MKRRLVAVVGPTASGKSALGMALAERVGGVLISADARQVYRGLDIGTAKPSPTDRSRVAHHCLDLVDPDDPFDVGQWVEAADAAIAGTTAPVVVVGGTGLYVRVLLRGLCEAVPRNVVLRAALRRLAERAGPGEVRRWLARLDPAAAARLHANDATRIERALEVALVAGRPLSALQRTHGFAAERYDARVVVLAPAPQTLAARIERRLDEMLAAGWVAEVEALTRRVADEAPAWRTLGYRELRDHVRGRIDLAATRTRIASETRRFAKRQRTWWRREARMGPVGWLDPGRDGCGAALDAAAEFLVANSLPDG